MARLEAIRMLIAFAAHMEFKLYEMFVKSAFLNGFLQEEVFVKQPPGFEDPDKPEHVYKLEKTLYRLSKLQEHGMIVYPHFLLRMVTPMAK